MSDIVAEGFSPGVMDRWGLGYDELRRIKPDIIYAQQSGMGTAGRYGRLRAVGPIAAALSGMSEMSGLPEPAMPAGWGYSYLDWIGAYSFATAILAALYHRDRTGEGQWIDASQTEAGIYISGGAILDWSANGRAPGADRQPLAVALGRPACDLPLRGRGPLDRHRLLHRRRVGGAGRPDRPGVDGRVSRPSPAGWPTRTSSTARVEAWTRERDAYQLMEELQTHGVAAGVCQTAGDRCDRDPQLAHLDWLTEVEGSKIGRWPVAEFPVKLSETPAHIGGPDQPRGALLRRGQRVGARGTARNEQGGDDQAGGRGRDLR